MPDVLLSNDDVTVLGPPNTVEVLLDIGPTGTRGSKVFVGSGDPNGETVSGVIFGQTLVLNDLYINTSPGPNYAYMYQYISQPGGNTWIEILELNPTLYSKAHTTTYVDENGDLWGIHCWNSYKGCHFDCIKDLIIKDRNPKQWIRYKKLDDCLIDSPNERVRVAVKNKLINFMDYDKKQKLFSYLQ